MALLGDARMICASNAESIKTKHSVGSILSGRENGKNLNSDTQRANFSG
jgi:hypothetical protein